jgi:hypothetical protein
LVACFSEQPSHLRLEKLRGRLYTHLLESLFSAAPKLRAVSQEPLNGGLRGSPRGARGGTQLHPECPAGGLGGELLDQPSAKTPEHLFDLSTKHGGTCGAKPSSRDQPDGPATGDLLIAEPALTTAQRFIGRVAVKIEGR